MSDHRLHEPKVRTFEGHQGIRHGRLRGVVLSGGCGITSLRHEGCEKAGCGKQTEPYIIVSLWGELPKSEPSDYSIGYGKVNLAASRSLKKGKCVAATSGGLHLEKFSGGKVASGTYELYFADGSVERGRFDATWCHEKFICG